MPTHMRNIFSVQELQDLELAEPFEFTKGCKTLKIPAQPANNGYEHGTRLYNLKLDPKQEHLLLDPKTEARLVAHMIELMKWNDAPDEQFTRMGLENCSERSK